MLVLSLANANTTERSASQLNSHPPAPYISSSIMGRNRGLVWSPAEIIYSWRRLTLRETHSLYTDETSLQTVALVKEGNYQENAARMVHVYLD